VSGLQAWDEFWGTLDTMLVRVGLYKRFVLLFRGVGALITFFADTPVSGARTPPFIAHAVTQNIRVPTRPPFIATHHTILVIAKSCKG